MSGLLGIQQQLAEVGRIRLGDSTPRGNGKTPKRLDTFRVTSPSREVVEAVAAKYGGTAREWAASPSGRQYEVTTQATSMSVAVIPGQAITQYYEAWDKGECTHRCDGRADVRTGEVCNCGTDSASRDRLRVSPTTRLNVLLTGVPVLGRFRLDSTGFYAASELASAVALLESLTASNRPVPALLRLEQRTRKHNGTTSRFAVPVLDLMVAFDGSAQMLASPAPAAALPAADEPYFPERVAPAEAPGLPSAGPADGPLDEVTVKAFERACVDKGLSPEVIAVVVDNATGGRTTDPLGVLRSELAQLRKELTAATGQQ